VELRHLRYFIRAAELLHFTRAAESLYISQPTLSVHIQQLEEELGAQLFARVGRNVRLTEAGELLLNRARQAVQELETAGVEIAGVTGLLRGTLCISSLPLWGSRLMPGWITAFNAIHPNVRIQARSGTTEDIEAGIATGAVDLGFSMLPAEHAEFSVQKLFSDEIVIVLSKKHPLAKKKALAASDLQDCPMALPSHRISSARALGRYFETEGFQPAIAVEYDDGHALLELVKSSHFITTLPKRSLPPDPELCALPLPGPGLPVTLGAMWSFASPATKAFLEIATQAVKDMH